MLLTWFEAEQTANGTVTHASRIQKTSASGGGKIGQIRYSDSAVTFNFQVGAVGNYRIRSQDFTGLGPGVRIWFWLTKGRARRSPVRRTAGTCTGLGLLTWH